MATRRRFTGEEDEKIMDFLCGKVRLATGNAIWREAEALDVGLLLDTKILLKMHCSCPFIYLIPRLYQAAVGRH